jgi:hypothetical protein
VVIVGPAVAVTMLLCIVVGPPVVVAMPLCTVCPLETRTEGIPVIRNASTRNETFSFFIVLLASPIVAQNYTYDYLLKGQINRWFQRTAG